jgi:trk system potassium uptake protein TrkA
VLALSEIGVRDIWGKAIQDRHGRILKRTGAHHVIYPEAAAMGERVGHMVAGKVIDFMEFDDGFAIVKTRAPAEAVGRSLGETQLRRRHGITVVALKRRGSDFTYATADTVVEPGDLLIVSGSTEQVERFAALS